MDAFVFSTRFGMTSDGQFWTRSGILGYDFWTRYFDVYDNVHLVGQAYPIERATPDWFSVTGERVIPVPVRPFSGPFEIFANYSSARKRIAEALKTKHVAIHLRAPSPLATLTFKRLTTGQPFGVEVAGDPYDSLAPGAFAGILRPVFRNYFRKSLAACCAAASATAYVTERSLQRRYPGKQGAFTTHFSSIELREDAFAKQPRLFNHAPNKRIVYVGTMNQLYKAPHILISAFAQVASQHPEYKLFMVGDGQFRQQLEEQAEKEAPGKVLFAGRLPAGEGVRSALAEADLFVLPSFQEGLPKATIEAMAMGLPCIGSTVGGFDELLDPHVLVTPGSVPELSTKIAELLSNASLYNSMAQANLVRARDYHIDKIRARRIEFYQYVQQATKDWIEQRSAHSTVKKASKK